MGKIGIIGGSGLYNIEGIKNVKKVSVVTPFGKPSDKFITGKLEGREVVFLPRHGVGHRISPSEINYRANIYAMKKLGVERIVSVTACGSLREDFKPLDFVIPHQFVDRTNQARPMTFFGSGIVAHISFADPVCPGTAEVVSRAAKSSGVIVHDGATYINMEGPAFSTRAESELYRKWGMDIIGMTNMSEAKLAREAEICYVTLAAITDYDCWYKSRESVTLEMVIQNLFKNVDNAKKIIREFVKNMPQERSCGCGFALKDAIVTDRKLIPAKVKKDLKIFIGKYGI
ncbi:MAG: S-methyl-5'-thioadenosine phosphorylase [Candidatus Omnitrophota bacterium]